MMRRFNDVAQLIDALEKLPGGILCKMTRHTSRLSCSIIFIFPRSCRFRQPELKDQFAGSDFSPTAIAQRAQEGEIMTKEALRKL
jgi:hypothetical protein